MRTEPVDVLLELTGTVRVPSRRLDPPGVAARPHLATGSPDRPRSGLSVRPTHRNGGTGARPDTGRTTGGLDPDPDATGAERGLRREYERLLTASYQNICRVLTKPYRRDGRPPVESAHSRLDVGQRVCPPSRRSHVVSAYCSPGGLSVSGDRAVSRGSSGSAVRSHRLTPVLHSLGRRRRGDGAAGDHHRRKPSGDGGRAVGSPANGSADRGHVEESGNAIPSDGTGRE